MEKNLDALVEKIQMFCAGEEAVVAAYLFGSTVAAESRREPDDIDIALLIDDAKTDSFSLLSFMSALEKEVGKRVDATVLNRAGEVLKFEVRSKGMLIFERSREKRIRFEVLGRKTYEDFLYFHNRYVNKVLYGDGRGKQDPED
jgi:uncharacterized protein